jgi:hypothetical protein
VVSVCDCVAVFVVCKRVCFSAAVAVAAAASPLFSFKDIEAASSRGEVKAQRLRLRSCPPAVDDVGSP